MTYANCYRPQGWSDLVGQKHISLVLQAFVSRSGTMPPSLVFAGSRGTGKTTTARILASALGCDEVDFLELDGASSGGVADMRELRQNAMFAPVGKVKCYVIDECQSLSKEAWNALLKVLEEPPPHVLFVFCTTEPEKVPLTIVSRSLTFNFRRLTIKDIQTRLQYVCEQEGIAAEPEALERIAVAVDGGMRNALMTLEQAAAVSAECTLGIVNEVLGLADEKTLFNVVEYIVVGDVVKLEGTIRRLFERGASLEFFLRDMQQLYAELLRYYLGMDLNDLDISSARKAFLTGLRQKVDLVDIRRVLEALWKLQERVTVSGGSAHLAFLTGLLLLTKDAANKPLVWKPPAQTQSDKCIISADDLVLLFQ